MNSMNKKLTNKQKILFARLAVGSMAWHYEIECGELTSDELEAVNAEITALAVKLLGVHPSFGETEKILQYVQKRQKP